jgi:hypothetical protein
MAYTSQISAVMMADTLAKKDGKQRMIVLNKKTGLFSIKDSSKKKLKNERIVYYTKWQVTSGNKTAVITFI